MPLKSIHQTLAALHKHDEHDALSCAFFRCVEVAARVCYCDVMLTWEYKITCYSECRYSLLFEHDLHKFFPKCLFYQSVVHENKNECFWLMSHTIKCHLAPAHMPMVITHH